MRGSGGEAERHSIEAIELPFELEPQVARGVLGDRKGEETVRNVELGEPAARRRHGDRRIHGRRHAEMRDCQ